MGNFIGRSSVDVINSKTLEDVKKAISSCVNAITEAQIMALKQMGKEVIIRNNDFSQIGSLNQNCIFSSNIKDNIDNDLATSLVNYAEKRGQLFLIFKTNNKIDAISALDSRFKKVVSQQAINKAISSISKKYDIRVENINGDYIFLDNGINETTTIVAETILNDTGYRSIITDIGTIIQLQAGNDTTELDARRLLIIIGLVILCIIILCCLSSSIGAASYYKTSYIVTTE